VTTVKADGALIVYVDKRKLYGKSLVSDMAS
jgi:hypothetical protein